jgi:Uma2 family endonuclease
MSALINPTVRRAEDVERWTHEEFMRLAPDDKKAELIDGEIIIMSPAFDEHERLQGFLFTILTLFVSQFDLGHIRGSRTAVYISDDQTYEPDILFVSKARSQIITKRKLTEAPDLVIEIISANTATHDRGTKRENYSKAGIHELWLIDPYGPAGTQFYQRQADTLVEVAPVDGIIHSLALPNFKLRTAWLWPSEKNELANPLQVLKELGVL